MQINIGSTEFLALLAHRGAYLLFEKGAPAGNLKRDMIAIKDADGRDLEIQAGGYRARLELPRVIFDDFLRASFIRQDGTEDDQHRVIFRLTDDGLERGLSLSPPFAAPR